MTEISAKIKVTKNAHDGNIRTFKIGTSTAAIKMGWYIFMKEFWNGDRTFVK